MRKKWLSVMLSAAMVLGMATPAYAQADPGSAQELQQETLESGSGDDTGIPGGTEEVNEVAQQDFVNSEDTEVVEEEAPVVYAGASSSGKVYFSMEKFTLGRGYVIEPEIVSFSAGETYENVLLRALQQAGVQYKGTSSSYGFYLSSIRDNDTEPAAIPDYIEKAMSDNKVALDGRADANWLGEKDYTSQSGWMYIVNNKLASVGVSSYEPADGDVIRFQFSVYGMGSDFGFAFSGEPLIHAADKDALTKRIAEINDASEQAYYGDSYTEAVNTLTKIDASQQEVDDALAGLKPGMNVSVTIRAQQDGKYCFGFADPIVVSSQEAENFGYEDSVKGVSVLDALVKAHEILYGEAFTTETASTYLKMSPAGYATTLFGKVGTGNGFLLNEACPNDGTEAEGGGYNGVTMTEQVVANGDVLDFFTYQDMKSYSDVFSWLDVPAGDLNAGSEAEITVTGVKAMNSYLYQNAEEMKAAATPVEKASLAWINAATGEQSKISSVTTDAAGKAKITLPAAAGEYWLVAVSDSESGTYVIGTPAKFTVKVLNPVNAELVLSSSMTSLKLYAVSDTGKANDLLKGKTAMGSRYNVRLVPGYYILEGYNGTTFIGSIKIQITGSELANRHNLHMMTFSCRTPSGWTYGTDYTVENLNVVSKTGLEREAVLGDSVRYAGSKTFIAVEDDTYSYEAVPMEANQSEYTKYSGTGTVRWSDSLIYLTMPLRADMEITIPYADTDENGKNDFVLEASHYSNYIVHDYVVTDGTSVINGDTETYTFESRQYETWFFRVTNPTDSDAVTYGVFRSPSAPKTSIKVTRSDMYVGQETNRDTVVKDFSKNTYDTGDIYLNVNEKGYLSLQQGEDFRLYPFRYWLPEDSMGNTILQPDFHVEVVELEGSDVISVEEHTEDASSKYSYTLKAENEGTAIVKVTYDALQYANGKSGKRFFSAIWPENTGVFVVTVGKNSGIQTGMTLNEGLSTDQKLAGDAIDSEFDVLYYAGDDGASYTFTPEAGTKVSASVCSYEDGEMVFGAFTGDHVTENEDGSVTLTGLTTGRTIVRMEKDNRVEYQVLRAAKSDYKIYKKSVNAANLLYDSEEDEYYCYSNGKKTITANAYAALTAEEQAAYSYSGLKAGDTAVIAYGVMNAPAAKLMNVYSNSTHIALTAQDGKTFKGSSNSYTFASSDSSRQVKVTIPSDWEESTYMLNGNLCAEASSTIHGLYGAHRNLTYEEGPNTSGFTRVSSAYFGELPAVSLLTLTDDDLAAVQAVEEKIAAIGEVTLASKGAIEEAEAAYDALTEAQKQLVTNADVLAAARKSYDELEAVKAVEEKIAAIGEVTLASKGVIEEAEAAYDALTEAQKSQVGNTDVLAAARASYNDLEAAKAVEEKIEAIGEVTLESKSAIDEANAAWKALNRTQKKLVPNWSVLDTAKKSYRNLFNAKAVEEKIEAIGEVTLASKSAIEEAEAAYQALTADQKQLVTNTDVLAAARKSYNDLAAAKAVKDQIAAIGKVTLTSKSAIEAAESAYAALTAEQKLLVTNADVLAAARKSYNDLAAAKAVEDQIAAIGKVTLTSKSAIEKAEAAYEALTEEQKALVSNADLIAAAKTAYENLQKANEAERKISAIGAVNTKSLPAIEDAEAAYNALTEEQKALVSNADTLRKSRQLYEDQMAAKAVGDQISAIGTVTTDSLPAIKKAEAAYDALTPVQKILVPNKRALTAARAAYTDLTTGVKGFVNRLYQNVLNRKADKVGFDAWTGQLVRHEAGAGEVSKGFFFSPEFVKRGFSNREFVTICYQTYLDREPDQAGLNAWVKLLDQGRSADEILDGFINSPEFGKICASYGIVK